MENFSNDLDQALNELERLDAEEQERHKKEKNNKKTSLNIPIKAEPKLEQIESKIEHLNYYNYNELGLDQDDFKSVAETLEHIISNINESLEYSHKPVEQEKEEEEKASVSKNSELESNENETNQISEASEQQIQQEESSQTQIEVIDFQTEWSQLSESEKILGLIAPNWLPDSEADSCLKCGIKFTFRKRRHHCRACGLIFCSECCNYKLKLPYKLTKQSTIQLSVNQEGSNKSELSRICSICYETINKVNNLRTNLQKLNSTIPVVSALKKKTTTPASNGVESLEETSSNGRRKSVRFSDGLTPGENIFIPDFTLNNSTVNIFDSTSKEFNEAILIVGDSDSEISFKLIQNLRVNVKIVNTDKCGKFWLFKTNGLCINAQDELVYMLKHSIEDDKVPRQILYHVMDIYDKSTKGHRVSNMSHLLYDFESEKIALQILNTNLNSKDASPSENCLLNNKDNSGFIYFRPSSYHIQMMDHLREFLPNQPYLIGYLIQKWEIPWAKLFPLRLFLRLGEQFDFYPCPVISDRLRKPVYGEIGHTIMSLLSDTRNYQYTIPQIDGVSIHMDGLNTKIIIPESQYDFIMKSILISNEYVFSLASLQMNDSFESHLVAVENENIDSYSTKTFSCLNKTNNLIGAAFVVFNGAFKPSLTLNAKHSVIEDGLMVQIDIETMGKLKQALKSMSSFKIECSKTQQDNIITIEWIKEDKHLNKHVFSIIDHKCLRGFKNLRLSNSYEYVHETKSIRWTEIYLLKIEEDLNSIEENSFNLNRFADMVAQAACTGLLPLLNDLIKLNQIYLIENKKEMLHFEAFRVGLRVEINKDQVGYQLGMNFNQIQEQKFLENLDNELVNLLNQANNFNINILIELVFYIQERLKI